LGKHENFSNNWTWRRQLLDESTASSEAISDGIRFDKLLS